MSNVQSTDPFVVATLCVYICLSACASLKKTLPDRAETSLGGPSVVIVHASAKLAAEKLDGT